MEDYSKYPDDTLVKMMEKSYDLDESVFFALPELSRRKHSRTKEFCLEILNRDLGNDEHFVASALSTLYNYDEDAAIEYATIHHKDFHIYSLGRLTSKLWVDSETYEENPKKRELVKLIKKHLKTLKKSQIAQIQDDYDEFMKAYKNV